MDFKNLPPLDAETVEFLKKQEAAMQAARESFFASVENELIKRLEEHLGRVPSDEEMRQHGQRIISRDGSQTFTWKGDTILVVASPFKLPEPTF